MIHVIKRKKYFVLIVIFILLYTLVIYNFIIPPIDDDNFDISLFYQQRREPIESNDCTFQKCFNISRCLGNDLKLYVYPNNEEAQEPSLVYSKFLSILRKLKYTTTDPSEACLFILSIDTIDRDRISENYIRDVDAQILKLPKDIWNNGMNHLIFNFYHGTYPDYADHNLGFNYSKAMIARSSFSASKLRYNFDISFPLFHADHTFTKKDAMKEKVKMKRYQKEDKYFVSFKGKRYVYGIGSETRDSLHHLHNGENIIMATTCKHNNDWKKFEDSRCEKDNEMYDHYDYNDLLRNSTFCLAPRGRRLASFRFLESLKAGCIPVILSDDWVLPFDEIVNWNNGVVYTPENMSFLLIDQLGRLTYDQVKEMRKFGEDIYWKYLSNYESIIETSIDIIFNRVKIAKKQLKMN
uniref:Exostosin domain-containing protein n=1 Tax=Parastrongyloides trichosuri TaxID=131310 RepID=A0A0N4Z1S6_PARTI